MEILLLLNGLAFCYLLFSGNLSERKDKKNKKAVYIGSGIFLLFFIVLSFLYYSNNIGLIDLITWIALIVTSIALLMKLFESFSKVSNNNSHTR